MHDACDGPALQQQRTERTRREKSAPLPEDIHPRRRSRTRSDGTGTGTNRSNERPRNARPFCCGCWQIFHSCCRLGSTNTLSTRQKLAPLSVFFWQVCLLVKARQGQGRATPTHTRGWGRCIDSSWNRSARSNRGPSSHSQLSVGPCLMNTADEQ